MAPDSYGVRCECDQFIEDRAFEDDDEPEDDPNEFLQPRAVSQLEEVLHAQSCADFYAGKARESAISQLVGDIHAAMAEAVGCEIRRRGAR